VNALDAMVGSLTRAPRRFRIYPVKQHCETALAHCNPRAIQCPQEDRCARASVWADKAREVDASICLAAGACPMFIDSRAVALLAS
jgi:hypothetical protein